MDNPIRVWITGDTSPDHLRVHHVKPYRNDIVLVYQDGRLASITGYNTRVIKLPQLIWGMDFEVLSNILPVNKLEEDLNEHGYFRLSNKQWQQLKNTILQRNHPLGEIISLLEEAQMKYPRLSGDEAFAYDALWTVTRMFQNTSQQILQEVFNDLREARQAAAYTNIDAIEQLFQTLEMSAYFQPVNRVQDNTYKFADRFFEKVEAQRSEPKPPRTEEDVIRGDATDFPEWDTDKDYYEDKEWNRHAIRMIDPRSGRELFIFLAHRKGIGKSGSKSKDAAGADLIYASREHRSFVLVQYKLLKPYPDDPQRDQPVGEKLQLHGKDYEQLEELLGLCDGMQRCSHVECREPQVSYAPSSAIRLANCPVFYKLIGRNHDLLPSSDFIEGDYVPACYIRSLIDEKRQKTLRFPEDIQRTLGYMEFTKLTGHAYLGSRADAYDRIFQHIHKALPSGVVLLALEENILARNQMSYSE